MDLAAIKRLRSALTLHFAIIACLTAMLVATGSQSFFLPVFMFFVTTAAYIFVDRLEWFEVGRIGSYVGMIAATVFSIGSYLYSVFSTQSESGQLLAIAGLLVYPEAVLFMQRKNLRVFEQIAVFLLLEMIVAALVNDNLLFGLLLAPIMLLWVSALFLFSRYATLVQIDSSLERPLPVLVEVLFKRFMTRVIGENKKISLVSPSVSVAGLKESHGLRRILQSIPIGVGAIVFAAFFFYLLPRTIPANVEPAVDYSARVGLPRTLSIGVVGRLLADPTPVMRVSLTEHLNRTPYPVREPPYLRARVLDAYGSAKRGNWVSYGEWIFAGATEYRRLPIYQSRPASSDMNSELVEVEFDIRRQFAATMFSVPPSFTAQHTNIDGLNYDRFNMVLEELDPTKIPRSKSLVYSISTTAFNQGVQSRVIPAVIDVNSFSAQRNFWNLARDFRDFQRCNVYREQLMQELGVDPDNPIAVAKAIEDHFTDGRFEYTLDLRPPVDPELDPIEDFLVNQRRGHCQYFASAMLMLLRQSNIPSRIVLGYRPTSYNELGKYFTVRQSDAHAWVEALFTIEELQGSEFEPQEVDSPSYWVRFDPTPSSDGSARAIVTQQGQAIDYAEKLWKDYVVEGQKLAGDDTFYAPVAANSKNAYEQFADSLRNLGNNLKSGRITDGTAGIGSVLQVVVALVGVVMLGLLLCRVVARLPTLAPKLAFRLGMKGDPQQVKQTFFARCLKLLAQHGLARAAHETPSEFTRRASQELALSETTDRTTVRDSLAFMTDMYYRLRFSQDNQLSLSEEQRIDRALKMIGNLEQQPKPKSKK